MKREVKGVHLFWWFFWLVVFWPALFFVWMTHNSKIREIEDYNRDVEIHNLKQEIKKPNRVIRRLEKEMRDE